MLNIYNFRALIAVVILFGAIQTMPSITYAGDKSQTLLIPSYRVGPFAPNGIPLADGFIDYFTLINERDGGINGVKLVLQECETQYENSRGIDCYERYKDAGEKGIPIIAPMSAGIAASLYERMKKDHIPVITEGHGRLGGAYGALFPYDFPIMGNDWDLTNAMLKFIAQKEGGEDKLKGKKIALVFLESAYGRNPFPVLDEKSKRLGFTWDGYPVLGSAMVEQRSTWLAIRRSKPDYVLIWGWGVMTPTAIKEAAATGYPVDRVIGNWFSAAEPDVIPAGDAAIGYVGATFRMPGKDFPIFDELKSVLYDKGKGTSDWDKHVGSVNYAAGFAVALVMTEAMKIAMAKYGNRPLTGDEARWGLEHLNLDEAALEKLGFLGMIAPLKLTCEDHKGAGSARFIQWDGTKWNAVTDWIDGRDDTSADKIKEVAEKIAAEVGNTPRDCATEG